MEYSKNPQIRTYTFEMSLPVFLFDELAPIIRAWLLTHGPTHMLGKRIVDCFAFKYYCNLLNLDRSKHMYEPAHLNYACGTIWNSIKGAKWQKDWTYIQVDKTRTSYKDLAGMSCWKGSNYLKSKCTISGCTFFVDDDSYARVLTVYADIQLMN